MIWGRDFFVSPDIRDSDISLRWTKRFPTPWHSGLMEGVNWSGDTKRMPAHKDLHDVKLKRVDLLECDLSKVNSKSQNIRFKLDLVEWGKLEWDKLEWSESEKYQPHEIQSTGGVSVSVNSGLLAEGSWRGELVWGGEGRLTVSVCIWFVRWKLYFSNFNFHLSAWNTECGKVFP